VVKLPELFFEANGMDAEGKVAMLVTLLGPKVYVVFAGLSLLHC